MNNWFNVPITQTPIFVLFLSAGVLFDCAFSLWVSIRLKISVWQISVVRMTHFAGESSLFNHLVWRTTDCFSDFKHDMQVFQNIIFFLFLRNSTANSEVSIKIHTMSQAVTLSWLCLVTLSWLSDCWF